MAKLTRVAAFLDEDHAEAEDLKFARYCELSRRIVSNPNSARAPFSQQANSASQRSPEENICSAMQCRQQQTSAVAAAGDYATTHALCQGAVQASRRRLNV